MHMQCYTKVLSMCDDNLTSLKFAIPSLLYSIYVGQTKVSVYLDFLTTSFLFPVVTSDFQNNPRPSIGLEIRVQKPSEDINSRLFFTSGFWPRVRARALRAPVFWNSLPRQTGARAPPAHRSFAASYSTPKNK